MASSTNHKILLRGGTALIHDQDLRVRPTVCDILVEGDKIARIEPSIQLDGSEANTTKTIDCQGKIITPGFVSTHNHLYQTPLKGRHANHTLLEYFPTGGFTGSFYSLDDTFWGQLGGALEAIDAGTTTIVDHAGLNLTPDYCEYYPGLCKIRPCKDMDLVLIVNC